MTRLMRLVTGSAFSEETADSEHAAGLPSFGRQQWLDLVKWAHNTNTLSHEDRIRIVKLGRLIQKGRRLTRRQEAQLAEPWHLPVQGDIRQINKPPA